MHQTPTMVVTLLAILAASAWLVYRLLENVQDNYRGLTLEQSLAKRDTGRSRHAGPVAGSAPRPVAVPPREPSPVAPALPQYPRVIYKCPLSVTLRGGSGFAVPPSHGFNGALKPEPHA